MSRLIQTHSPHLITHALAQCFEVNHIYISVASSVRTHCGDDSSVREGDTAIIRREQVETYFRERILLRDAFSPCFSSRLKATRLANPSKVGNYGKFRQICPSTSDLANSGFIKTQALLSDCYQLSNKVCSRYFSKTTLTLWCLCCAKGQRLQQPPESLNAGPGLPVLCSPPTVKKKYIHCIYLHDTAPPKRTTDKQSLEANPVAIVQTPRVVGGRWLGQDFHPQNFKMPRMSELKLLSDTRRVPEQYLYFGVILCSTELSSPKRTP